jgi:hypothetical protein
VQFSALWACLLCLIFCEVGYAQKGNDEDEVAKHHFELFSQSAAVLNVKEVGGSEPFRLEEVPLQKFTAAGQIFGAVFAWTDSDGRLAMIGTIGSLPINETEFEFIELHLIKPQAIQPVIVDGYPNKTWSPEIESLQPRALTSVSEIGKTPAKRLIEMRSLIRDFRAEQRHEGKTNKLRLLPQPLYRMADSSPERDEALFAFVGEDGTDPEVLVRLVILENDRIHRWHYQVLRFNWREQVLFQHDREVWHVAEFLTRDAQSQVAPYLTGLTKRVE